MKDVAGLVHIVDEVPEEAIGLPMVLSLDGFLDAGNATARAVQHLLDQGSARASAPASGGPVLATFDVDALHDYRARRPPMSFVHDHYEAYEAPRLVVRLLHDQAGNGFLLLQGPEPDHRWEAFCLAVREVVERLEVTTVLSLGAVPMAVPHTRPIAVTPHANRPELLDAESPWRGELRIPSSAQALLEVRLGEWGHDALGFVVHIPHYLAQLDYPRGTLTLLGRAAGALGLTLDVSGVEAEAADRDAEIARYLANNEEVSSIVTALENQYDAFDRGQEDSLLAEGQPLPTAEELGEQFQQFLSDLEDPDQT
jgi:hypothetical protein